MTIKSLTITEKAYDTLKALKYGDESFSDVILRTGQEKVGAAAKFFGALKMSTEEAKEWKARIKKNRDEINKDFELRRKEIQRSFE
ncbi:hypothetical protein HY837_02755 [archaeon]|nr:hypothetical protein [archaeon]